MYETFRRSKPGFDREKDRRKSRPWYIAVGTILVLYYAMLIGLMVMMQSNRLPPTKPAASFVFGADGPALSGQTVRSLKLTTLQTEEVNQTLRRYAEEAKALNGETIFAQRHCLKHNLLPEWQPKTKPKQQ